MMKQSFNTYVDLQGQQAIRLDIYVADLLQLMSRSQIKTQKVQAWLDHKPCKWSHKVINGQHLQLEWEELAQTCVAEPIDLDILYEDDNVWVINKPSGMAVHPGAGRSTGTVANGLAYLLQNNNEFGISERTGIVHRLDMDTSGVMICAKNTDAHEFLSQQFRDRSVKKRYLAITGPYFQPPMGILHNYIARSRRNRKTFHCGDNPDFGRVAVTRYRLAHRFDAASLILFKPETGRTHQLRVHARYLGYPIIGDKIYGQPNDTWPLMLHAWKLSIILPGHDEPQVFCAPVPQRFKDYLLHIHQDEV
jgi:23S rRNA pseudouridine1911/1915/1917 synthase